MKRRLLLCKVLLVCFILPDTAICQFTYQAAMGDVQQSGFHKILITPELAAKSNADFSDIRIIDEQGKFIPYILKREQPFFNEKEMRVFPLVSEKLSADSNLQMIFQPGFPITPGELQNDSSFVLLMQSAAAYRDASISGSNDLRDWYTIIDRFVLDAGNNENAEQSVQVIDLPPNRYRYLRLIVKNKGLQPIRIVKAGSLLSKSISGEYGELPVPLLKQVDSSNKKSYVSVRWKEAYPISKIRFNIASPRLYKRKLALYDTAGKSNIKVAEAIIDPSTDSIILDGAKRKNLIVVVENNDDQPLQFANATAYQLQHHIIADLQQGKKYDMLMGDVEAGPPVYDLHFFSDSIKPVNEKLRIEIPLPYKNDTGNKGLKPDKLPFTWVWVAIGVVLCCLVWLSFRLIKDIPNKQQ